MSATTNLHFYFVTLQIIAALELKCFEKATRYFWGVRRLLISLLLCAALFRGSAFATTYSKDVHLFFVCCHRNMQLGVSAIVCYLHACRHQNEAKCRKYLARTIWLMTYDDEKVWFKLWYTAYYFLHTVVSIISYFIANFKNWIMGPLLVYYSLFKVPY